VQGVERFQPALQVRGELGGSELHGGSLRRGGGLLGRGNAPAIRALAGALPQPTKNSSTKNRSTKNRPPTYAASSASVFLFATATRRNASTARSISSSVIVSGGAKRITVSCVSLESTPAAASAST